MSRADFARMQREALENYLINLIRTVVSYALSRNFVHLTDPLSPDVSPFFKSTRWIS